MAEGHALFTLIVTILGAIAQTIVFIYFCFSIYKILRSHNRQFKENEKRLDNYLITTLALIGISVASLLTMSIIDTADGTNSGPTENEIASHLRTLQ
jgi:peptidoglycan biosynthesis protein MviN/MurJ (putative lipid II flippase)